MLNRPFSGARFRFAPRMLLLVVLATLSVPAHAQTIVAGRVLDDNGAPVPSAKVQLLVHSDSSVAKTALVDAAGNFVLEAAEPGTYLVHASQMGYRGSFSDPLTVAGDGKRQLGPLVLQQEAVVLEGISVETKKALYQQRGDRMVINVGSSPTLAGSSALQVLERSPGVIVDKMSNTVSLVGKDGVRVMINGRLSHIPADGLAQYLSGVSADNVEKIELITSPPASLEAEGNAGYINIVIKRRPDEGLNGTATMSGGYGEGEVGSASTNVNYRQGKISFFGNYSFLWDAQLQVVSSSRRVVDAAGVADLATVTRRDPVQRNHDTRVGIEYQVNDKTAVGALVSAYDNRWTMDALNQSALKDDGIPVTRIDSDNDEVNHWRHVMGNLNLQQKLGGAGTLRMDLDYLRYSNDNPTVYLNSATDIASGQVTKAHLESGKNTPLRILVANADYTRANDRWEFGAGVKGAFSRFTNKTSLTGDGENEWASEAGFGSTSMLQEDVIAVYGTAKYAPSEATSVDAGLRYELTDSNLGSDEEQNIVDRRFGNFFPSVAASHKLSDAHQIGASYTRRITRPSFRDMAPFLYFFDPYTFFSGNAGLQAAIVNTIKLDGSYKSVIASLQYAWEDSTIARFQSRLLPGHNIQVVFPTNFRGTQSATALVGAPIHLTSWWSTQNNAMATWQEVEGVHNSLPVTLTSTSARFNSTHSLALPRGFTLEGSGFYQGAGLAGAVELEPFWGVDLALQKTLTNDAKLTLSASDVFDSVEFRGTTGSPGDAFYTERLLDFSQPTISLTYSTRFGNSKTMRKRATASEEESGRVQ